MSPPLDDQYLTWLYDQVASARLKNPSRTYWRMLRQLYTKEFVWLIPNDDNRVEDGRDLRYEFIDDNGIHAEVDQEWLTLGCSVLEMLIGLARRLAFEADGECREWFWKLIENLNLEDCNDRNYDNLHQRAIDEAIDRVVWRTYSPSGRGGLFPLKHSGQDQREVEIWYQLSAYLLDGN